MEDAGSEEPELQQLLQECDEMCGNSIWQGVVMQVCSGSSAAAQAVLVCMQERVLCSYVFICWRLVGAVHM